MPSEIPRGAITPITRKRSSPSRSVRPSGFRPGTARPLTFAPMTQTRAPRSRSPAGRYCPIAHRDLADLHHRRRDAGDGDVAARASRPGRGQPTQRRDPPREGDAAHDRLGVLEGQVVGRRCRRSAATPVVSVFPGRTISEVGAEDRELARDVEARPLAEARQEDDRGDADRHAEQRQPGAAGARESAPAEKRSEVAAPSRPAPRLAHVLDHAPSARRIRRRARGPIAGSCVTTTRVSPSAFIRSSSWTISRARGAVEVPGRLVGEQDASAPSRRRARWPRAGARRPRAGRGGASRAA